LALAVALTLLAPGAPSARTNASPILVELFTSEGCSSCPPADALLQSLEKHADVIVLGQHVDYWDRLGWKDRFSSAAATRRQQQYGQALGVESIYTPQMVVDGREAFVGSDDRAAHRAIGTALSAPHAIVSIAVERPGVDRLDVSASASDLPAISRGDRAEFVLAVTESGLRSDVRAGENKGRVLPHTAVVREMRAIGEASGGQRRARSEITVAPGWQPDQLRIVVFVQERASRRVLGAAAAALPSARQ
jgi:hypothetical protein